MTFLCPECSSHSLKITSNIEILPDNRSDEITLQVVKCANCAFSAIAVYEESRRGSLGGESFSHTGYRVHELSVRALKEMIRRCPQPRNKRCDCEVHQKLGRKDPGGRWAGLSGLEYSSTFQMER